MEPTPQSILSNACIDLTLEDDADLQHYNAYKKRESSTPLPQIAPDAKKYKPYELVNAMPKPTPPIQHNTTHAKPPASRGIDRQLYELDPSLSEEQKNIVIKALEGDSIFFTGAAGTGKSFVLHEIIRIMREFYCADQLYITAPTGIAAIPLNGSTIHAFAGIAMGEGSEQELVERVMKNAGAKKRWRNARVLIIDEISMVSSELFDKLEFIARRVRNSPLPFGGIQLILCGDFLQLPPVTRSGGQLPGNIFAFCATTWPSVVQHTFILTQVFRQIGDHKFVDMLNNMRRGEITDAVYAQLVQCINKPLQTVDGIEPTRLYPKKVEVAMENDKRLADIDAAVQTFIASDRSKYPNSAQLKQIQEHCPAPATLQLKIGAQVVLLKNMPQDELVNGSRGVVTGFAPAGSKKVDLNIQNPPDTLVPIVLFENGVKMAMGRETWSVMSGDEELAARVQIPLSLAWALSIHKSQGMTLSQIEVNLASIFEYGQAYVALSRVTSLAGLRIQKAFSKSVVRAHPAVIKFYDTLTPATNITT